MVQNRHTPHVWRSQAIPIRSPACEPRGSRADPHDAADDLVPGCYGAAMCWQVTHHDMQVGAAHATGGHPHEHLTRSGRGYWELTALQRKLGERPRLCHLPRVHEVRNHASFFQQSTGHSSGSTPGRWPRVLRLEQFEMIGLLDLGAHRGLSIGVASSPVRRGGTIKIGRADRWASLVLVSPRANSSA